MRSLLWYIAGMATVYLGRDVFTLLVLVPFWAVRDTKRRLVQAQLKPGYSRLHYLYLPFLMFPYDLKSQLRAMWHGYRTEVVKRSD